MCRRNKLTRLLCLLQAIRSIKETEPGQGFRKMMSNMMSSVGDPSAADPNSSFLMSPLSVKNTVGVSPVAISDEDDADAPKLSLRNRLTSLFSSSKPESDPSNMDDFTRPIPRLELPTNGIKSARQEAVANWWNYLIGAIIFEIRKRKHMTSMFRDMYMSFDWKRQRYRRKEYINLYISLKLDSKGPRKNMTPLANAVGSGMGWSFENEDEKRKGNEILMEIEDELPIEQILLYRSIARSMRVRGTSKMPESVLELWGADRRASLKALATIANQTSTPQENEKDMNAELDDDLKPMDALLGQDSSNMLTQLQSKFELSKKLRGKGGVLERFEASAAANNGTFGKRNEDDENLSTDAALEMIGEPTDVSSGNQPPTTRPGRRRSMVGSESKEDKTPSQHRRKASMGNYGSDLQAGKFYSSGGTKSQFGDVRTHVDAKTLRSNRYPQTRATKQQRSQSSGENGAVATDNRMRLYFSFTFTKFEFMVVEEDYYFEMSPDLQKGDGHNQFSPGSSKVLGMGDGDSSSGDDVSELSVLTDDQRYFSEQGNIGVIAEEEEDVGGAKLSSTDFLKFGHPENPLLRLTISSFLTTAKGVSGGGMQIGVSLSQIEAVGDGGSHLLSMGPSEQPIPVTEVDIDGSYSKRSRSFGTIGDGATLVSGMIAQRMAEGMTLTKMSKRPPSRAVSMKYSKDGPIKILQCDLSKIVASLNVEPVGKLLHFYSKTETKHPERLLTKSSHDVARKIMVQKLSSSPTKSFADIDSAIRIYGIEVKVPFHYKDANESEASDLDSAEASDYEASFFPHNQPKHYVKVEASVLELYSGRAVDELIQSSQLMSDVKDYSVYSGSLSSNRRNSTVRAMEMLNLAELTGAHDSFASKHFVATVGGIQCGIQHPRELAELRITDFPIDAEILLTSNITSLLDTVSPKQQVVVELSPVHVLLSQKRIGLLSAAKEALDFGKMDAQAHIKKALKPDPPRIDILSQRILSSLDITCHRVRLEIETDADPSYEDQLYLPAKQKEIIMEECLSDFLSVVSCFDFSLPNDEALSSAMQVCIGRLVGLGLTDDEAWGCTNAARLNFLDDVALMRQAQSEVLDELTRNAKSPVPVDASFSESEEGSIASSNEGSFDFVEESLAQSKSKFEENDGAESMSSTDKSDGFSDDDSKNSADIVETTVINAVEKTVAAFAPLLVESFGESIQQLKGTTVLVIEMPLGVTLSHIKMFYDDHMTFSVTSLVVTNKAGIELLTLVPHVPADLHQDGDDEMESHGNGVVFSRFALDSAFGFGKGGVNMSVLASDQGQESELHFRDRSVYEDIEIGELEFLFAYTIYEEIIDELSKLSPGQRKHDEHIHRNKKQANHLHESAPVPTASNVIMMSSLSLLFTSDTLVPFSRITMEHASYKNSKSMESLDVTDGPSWALAAMSMSLQNLSPEGQFYPETLGLLSTDKQPDKFPFQMRYFKSSDPWQVNNRLEIDFTGFRLFLIRQFIHEILQYFVYEYYGVGKLRKKHSHDVRDIHGNQKPPLLWSVNVYDSSIICPRHSSSCDMACFEVEDASISVSYIPESFKMPSESSPFQPSPQRSKMDRVDSHDTMSRSTSFMSLSDYEDCESEMSEEDPGPVSSHTSDLKKRLTIALDNVRVFTVLADDKQTRNVVESPIFRYLHSIDGRAEDGKTVYKRLEKAEQHFEPEDLEDFDSYNQSWEEISTDTLRVEVFFDSAPHTRLLIANHDGPNPFALDARLSQLCLLLSVWDNNMQQQPAMFPFQTSQVEQNAMPPVIPDDFPEYGTEAFVSYLENIDDIRSEICVMFKQVSVRCTYDDPGYFAEDPGCFPFFQDPYNKEKIGVILTLHDAVIHVLNNHLNVRRIGIGASALSLVDERRDKVFECVLSTNPKEFEDDPQRSWADLAWGLREDVRTLSSSLPQPVQFSVFMTPGWSMINIGANDANGIMHDLSWIWCLLDYFKSYYTNYVYGNLGLNCQRWAHRIKNAIRVAEEGEPVEFVPLPGVKVDCRIWLRRPFLCLPSDYHNANAPALLINSQTGLFYRYKSIATLSSQEVASTDLNLYFLNEFSPPGLFRQSAATGGSRPLIEGLSFGLGTIVIIRAITRTFR